MRIAIEARALASPFSGVATYVSYLLHSLASLEAEDEYHVIVDRPTDALREGYRTHVIPRQPWGGLVWWLNVRVPRRLAAIGPEVVHFTKADVPFATRRARFKTVVTVYDIIPLLLPASQSSLQRWYWPSALKRAVTLSHHVITISEASKRDMIDRWHVPSEIISVTPLAVDASRFQPTAVRLYNFPYILFVGRRDVRKNVPALIRAFAQIAPEVPHQLVIAGRPVVPRDGAEAEASRLSLGERIVWRTSISAQELPALLSGADLFVWPSVYEGWGFPPQEAMACGTPVIVSDGGALPEVVGEAGVVVPFVERGLTERLHDAVFEQRLAAAMLEVLRDPAKRQRLCDLGLARGLTRTWHDVALATRRVYELV